MQFLTKYQFHLISMGIMTLVIGFLFQKPLTGEYTFGGPDSLSPSAVHQGIIVAEEEYGKYPLWLPWVFSGLPSVHSFQNISDYYFPNYLIIFYRPWKSPASGTIYFILSWRGWAYLPFSENWVPIGIVLFLGDSPLRSCRTSLPWWFTVTAAR